MTKQVKLGDRFGLLVVIESEKLGRKWKLRCDCGTTVVVSASNLRTGNTKSCGCYRRSLLTKHGMCESREYSIWKSAKGRCRIPSHTSYPWYGGVGIDMCDEWADDFGAFYRDMGPCPSGYTIERLNPIGNYEPGNCEWAPRASQSSNRRTTRVLEYNGKRQHLCAWAREFGIYHSTLIKHLRRGRTMDWIARHAGHL